MIQTIPFSFHDNGDIITRITWSAVVASWLLETMNNSPVEKKANHLVRWWIRNKSSTLRLGDDNSSLKITFVGRGYTSSQCLPPPPPPLPSVIGGFAGRAYLLPPSPPGSGNTRHVRHSTPAFNETIPPHQAQRLVLISRRSDPILLNNNMDLLLTG
jgi:hypothetical protein